MNTRTNVKALAAVIGGSALVAMVGLSTVISQEPGADAVASRMNLGSTSTETTPSTRPTVAKAQPGIKGPAKFKAHT